MHLFIYLKGHQSVYVYSVTDHLIMVNNRYDHESQQIKEEVKTGIF